MEQGACECKQVEHFLTVFEQLDIDGAEGNWTVVIASLESCDYVEQMASGADQNGDLPWLASAFGEGLCSPLRDDVAYLLCVPPALSLLLAFALLRSR